jgi:hypothetical protein
VRRHVGSVRIPANGLRLPASGSFAAAIAVAAIAALLALAAPAGRARAAEPVPSIGIVKTVKGEAWVIADGVQAAATPGTPLTKGCIVRTGPAGTIGMTLKDDTVLAMGPGSELLFDDFQFSPASGALGLVLGMVRGTLEYVSGAIARLRPESVSIQTPSATLGVRGTRFLLKVAE